MFFLGEVPFRNTVTWHQIGHLGPVRWVIRTQGPVLNSSPSDDTHCKLMGFAWQGSGRVINPQKPKHKGYWQDKA